MHYVRRYFECYNIAHYLCVVVRAPHVKCGDCLTELHGHFNYSSYTDIPKINHIVRCVIVGTRSHNFNRRITYIRYYLFLSANVPNTDYAYFFDEII